MELIAPFSSLENMMEYLRRKKKEFRPTESDLEEFKNNRQTKGRDENYLYESDYLDVLPEQEPELPPKDDAFYDKVFTCGQSELSRRSWNLCRSRSIPTMLRTKKWNRLCTKRKWKYRLRLGKESP
ncbi:hypothetical protein NIB75_19405 [Bacteroides uniformis]|nr:hypothetical protein [Bacteroides uniformis]